MKEIFEKYEHYIMIVLGVLCIVLQKHILREFAWLFGLFLLFHGLHMCYEAKKNRKMAEPHGFSLGLLFAIVACGILIKREEALVVTSMFWGILGLLKCDHYLSTILDRRAHNKKTLLRYYVAFAVELVLSMILIFEDPTESIPKHIFILGAQLIVESLFELYIHAQKKKDPSFE